MNQHIVEIESQTEETTYLYVCHYVLVKLVLIKDRMQNTLVRGYGVNFGVGASGVDKKIEPLLNSRFVIYVYFEEFSSSFTIRVIKQDICMWNRHNKGIPKQ